MPVSSWAINVWSIWLVHLMTMMLFRILVVKHVACAVNAIQGTVFIEYKNTVGNRILWMASTGHTIQSIDLHQTEFPLLNFNQTALLKTSRRFMTQTNKITTHRKRERETCRKSHRKSHFIKCSRMNRIRFFDQLWRALFDLFRLSRAFRSMRALMLAFSLLKRLVDPRFHRSKLLRLGKVQEYD